MNISHTCSVRTQSKSAAKPIAFVVDGDTSARKNLELLISSAGWDPRPVASAEEFLALPRVMTASCLLVELRLPHMDGLELQQVVSDRAELPVIFMSGQTDIRATVQAMKRGAFEFLTKPLLADAVLNTIWHAIERSRAALLELAQVRALEERYESLSPREREVMSLVVSGRLNKQVGGDLGISEITVKAHRGKMMRKMQAASFAELVRMAATLRSSALVNPPAAPVRTESANARQYFRAMESYAFACFVGYAPLADRYEGIA